MTIKCNNVAPVNENMLCQELVDGKLTWNFTPVDYTDKKIAPGNYVYTFDVSTDDNQADLTKQFTVTVTLEDPCISPDVTQPTTTAQSYTITDAAGSYSLSPQFTVTPSFCANSISHTEPDLDAYIEWDEGS